MWNTTLTGRSPVPWETSGVPSARKVLKTRRTDLRGRAIRNAGNVTRTGRVFELPRLQSSAWYH